MNAPQGLFAARRAGVLLHPSSLPSPYGRGDLGHAAWRFVEFLAAAGFTVWQVLPLGPTHRECSPYDALSAFAGDPSLVSLDWLHDRGLLDAAQLGRVRAGQWSRQDALAAAAAALTAPGGAGAALRDEAAAFRAREAAWLEDFALFVALREECGGRPWFAWEPPLRDRQPAALAAARERHAARIAAVCLEQWLVDRQWQELRAYARERGIHVFGDVPIFVSHDSADVWAHRGLFRLAADGTLEVETGVPPDYFSAEGQRWGNPHYDWAAMQRDGFGWWRARIARQRALVDVLRIDHFRGLEACWEIPRGARAAEGRWAPAPGEALLAAIVAAAGAGTLVAENLGVITPAVESLRRAHALPGMRIIQFGFDGDPANPHLPHNHEALDVVYTGTHDNDTALGWVESLDPRTRAAVMAYFGEPAEAMPRPLLRAALASVARLAVLPMQDLLGLGSDARMNRPGIAAGNWGWQDGPGATGPELAARLHAMLQAYGRLAAH